MFGEKRKKYIVDRENKKKLPTHTQQKVFERGTMR
jgi:hypothetical protein